MKMIAPLISPWVEETNEFTRATYQGRDICALRYVAWQTSECEVGAVSGAAMFAADHMIHMKAEVCVVLVDQAVFTDASGPRDDEPT